MAAIGKTAVPKGLPSKSLPLLDLFSCSDLLALLPLLAQGIRKERGCLRAARRQNSR